MDLLRKASGDIRMSPGDLRNVTRRFTESHQAIFGNSPGDIRMLPGEKCIKLFNVDCNTPTCKDTAIRTTVVFRLPFCKTSKRCCIVRLVLYHGTVEIEQMCHPFWKALQNTKSDFTWKGLRVICYAVHPFAMRPSSRCSRMHGFLYRGEHGLGMGECCIRLYGILCQRHPVSRIWYWWLWMGCFEIMCSTKLGWFRVRVHGILCSTILGWRWIWAVLYDIMRSRRSVWTCYSFIIMSWRMDRLESCDR